MVKGTNDVSTLKMLNHELVKLDHFDGTNFSRWKDKMKFLLTALKLSYVLDWNLMPFPTTSDEDTDKIKAQRKKQEEDELICRGHILNTISERLYDLYTSMKSPKEIWNALEAKYKTKKVGTNKFIIQKYFDYKMLDNISILDQVHELQILVNKLRDLSINMPESFQVGAVIAKLPPSWNSFRKKLLHMLEDLNLEQFEQHLQIEEENRVKDGTNTDSKVNANNVNKVQSESSSETDKNLKVNKSGSSFKKNNSKNPNKDKKNRCAMVHVCNKKEQFKTYDESSIEQQVLIGNHNKAKVLEKDTIEVKMSSNKTVILTNIFHVLDIKKNLVSANLLCKSGVKAVLELDKLILSKNEIFVEKGYATDGNRQVVLNKILIVFNTDDDPKTFKEAMASRDSASRKEVINDEMDSILSNNIGS
ncbi:uncharacterized protein LOC111993088 [Quercus suber]|uniref:uncharacterized protein LOC111993088 n=1 Tax=Quercus suber TaxID=58331 RepID=UPI000CE16C7F|nr:uncharacterized protein LOC111993088 [Quercus suber]